ncbi:hemerythrin domain-containing protein [Zhengella sp. ZM62]|uniref:hemerythrin domain-containing protein n=1 Tax=Zhengella sedimenti TaxID=3390035 RepID=UPI003974BCD2
MSETELQTRLGLPDDLRVLLARYPREDWQAHENLGGMAQFWLQRHDMFRDLGGMLEGAVGEWRNGRIETGAFVQFFVPRLNFFLGQLEGHHQIEDHHYFPVFRRAEPRLDRGFDILDRDHHVIHAALEANAGAANSLLQAIQEGGDRLKRAGDVYAGECGRLVAMLMRHLDDEEDLIIPVILDQGERRIGVS